MTRRKPSSSRSAVTRLAVSKPVALAVPEIVRLEREVEAQFRPQMCAELERRIAAMAEAQPRNAPRCEQCGAAMESRGLATVSWLSRFGRICARVRGYRCRPCKRGCRPLLAALGVEVGRVSGSLARLLALLGVIVPYEMAARLCGEFFGVEVSAMCVWRCVQRFGEALAQEEEALARYHEDPHAEARVAADPPRIVVAAADGCALGMQVRAKRRRRRTADEILPPLEPLEEGHFREVKTGVLLAAQERVETSPGRRSVVRRHLVTCLDDADAVFARLWAKLCELGWHGTQTVVVVVGDGAEWIWNRAAMFPNHVEILDFWHAIEKAWEFARLRHGDGSKVADRWIHRLAGDLRAGKVAAVIARLEALPLAGAELVAKRDELVRYYTGNACRMRYDEYLRCGYGIGSGAVESAHKQVVHARMRQAGMRWSVAGARRLLALRVLLLSGDWKRLDTLRMSPAA